MILLIDNFDSFVHNLARYFERLGQTTRVVRNDTIDVAAIKRLAPEAIVISPGPKTPSEAGCSLDVVSRLYQRTPILGICLGHQAIGQALGAKVERAPRPIHGQTSAIVHSGRGVFAGLPSPIVGCRYHSLVVNEASLPAELEVTARTTDGVVMAIEHRTAPLVGLQFHPEAILTDHGYELLANFLRRAGINVSKETPGRASELVEPTPEAPLPSAPVTF